MNANGDGILCTEDNIPIRTIQVGNISSKLEWIDLKMYFERYGKVDSVSINRCRTMYMPYVDAFVTFTEPQSATKALRDNMHCILGNPTKVKAADSWRQPRNDEETCENQFSLLNLNDDCLLHIASFLEPSDLLNVSKTCKRLEYVSNVMFPSYKSLDTQLFEKLTLMRVRKILTKIGPHVQQIICRTLHTRTLTDFVQLLPSYCSNVKLSNLTLTRIKVGDYVYKEMIGAFKNLRTLKLQDCDISDNVCAVLYNCADLETLHLSRNREITGRHLDKLGNLQTLNLNECINLQPEFFKALCMQTKLVSLNIRDCRKLKDSAIETLANTQDKLEDLSISQTFDSLNLIPVTRLKNLKRLDIYFTLNTSISDNFFQELAKNRGAELEVLRIRRICFNRNVEQALYKLKNLKKLSIEQCSGIDSSFFVRMAKSTPLECFSSSWCKSVCNEDILNLIRFSDTIKKINIGLYEQINSELVTSAVEILKTKKLNEPFTLFVCNMYISRSILFDPIILNNSHLINVKFVKTLASLV